MMRGRGRESKNVSGAVVEKDSVRVVLAWRLRDGRDGAGGTEEVKIRLGMMAMNLRRGNWKFKRGALNFFN